MAQSTDKKIETNMLHPIKPRRFPSLRGCFAFGTIGLTFVCVLVAGSSAMSNVLLPSHSPVKDRLGDLDKARLSEALHMRRELGDVLWPGWGPADIPMILYNEEYVFLAGYPDPPAGWITIPGGQKQGVAWEAVPDDALAGQAYYWQRLVHQDISPQAFVVMIGQRWVSSLTSYDWMEIKMGDDFQTEAPSMIQPIFPYRLAARLFLSAAGGKDLYICALLHESFHAYEGSMNPTRLSAAETVFNGNQSRYPRDSEVFTEDWKVELNLLADAVQTKSDAELIERTRQFLIQRQQRRAAAGLDVALIELERQKEWEEGLAKYTELSIWRLAATTASYHPLPVMAGDPGFGKYAAFGQRWSQETEQIRRMASDEGDVRFYYSGFAQAVLLDRLAPDWRIKALTENVPLEELLRDAVD